MREKKEISRQRAHQFDRPLLDELIAGHSCLEPHKSFHQLRKKPTCLEEDRDTCNRCISAPRQPKMFSLDHSLAIRTYFLVIRSLGGNGVAIMVTVYRYLFAVNCFTAPSLWIPRESEGISSEKRLCCQMEGKFRKRAEL